jgi:hypothetical protein
MGGTMKRFSITMPEKILEALDKERGKTPRSTYITKIVQATISVKMYPMIINSQEELLDLAHEIRATEKALSDP